jgi:hypothetical protein
MDENFDIVFGMRHGWGQDSVFVSSGFPLRTGDITPTSSDRRAREKADSSKISSFRTSKQAVASASLIPTGTLRLIFSTSSRDDESKTLHTSTRPIPNILLDSIFSDQKTIPTSSLRASFPPLRHCGASPGPKARIHPLRRRRRTFGMR